MRHICYLIQRLAERRPIKSEAGVTAIEYALIAMFVALTIVGAVAAIGASLPGIFSNLAAGFTP